MLADICTYVHCMYVHTYIHSYEWTVPHTYIRSYTLTVHTYIQYIHMYFHMHVQYICTYIHMCMDSRHALYVRTCVRTVCVGRFVRDPVFTEGRHLLLNRPSVYQAAPFAFDMLLYVHTYVRMYPEKSYSS